MKQRNSHVINLHFGVPRVSKIRAEIKRYNIKGLDFNLGLKAKFTIYDPRPTCCVKFVIQCKRWGAMLCKL